MKIVVGMSRGGYAWGIESNGTIVCESSRCYTKKSDAKRGAERFEYKLWGEYMKWDNSNGKLADGPPIVIEVLD